ncbi:MAG: hypothetical protein A2007_03480 [Verrucomicrobia bacterium GWC2_42_7]|nr:MAG: hypothetical protein A2007_03480 [Verrucomicrobia bacterium GWC2_42_7]
MELCEKDSLFASSQKLKLAALKEESQAFPEKGDLAQNKILKEFYFTQVSLFRKGCGETLLGDQKQFPRQKFPCMAGNCVNNGYFPKTGHL